jgi:hypothetical protein
LQGEFLLRPLGGVRESREQLQPVAEMADRFHVGRALEGALAGALPVGNSLRHRTGLRIMMRQQFGLGLAAFGEARLQYLGNVLMVLLAGAPQQGLIGRVLDQGMLEEVRRLRWQTLLVQELRRHQLLQPPLQGSLIPGGDGLQQFIGKLTSERRPELRQGLHCR